MKDLLNTFQQAAADFVTGHQLKTIFNRRMYVTAGAAVLSAGVGAAADFYPILMGCSAGFTAFTAGFAEIIRREGRDHRMGNGLQVNL
ncbi:MAG: hypothetical protein AAF244_00050 [Pseudomonadota bacterium]